MNILKKYTLILLSVLGILISNSPTFASTSVNMIVPTACSLTTGTTSIGTYTGSAFDGNILFNAQCNPGTSATVTADNGTCSAGTNYGYNRCFTGPSSNHLWYGIYTNNFNTTIVDATHPVNFSGSGFAGTVNFSVHINAGQAPINGSYSDTLLITMTF